MKAWDWLVREVQNASALTEIVTSLDDVLGGLEGQQEVSGVPLSVHRLDKAEHKVCTQAFQFYSQERAHRHTVRLSSCVFCRNYSKARTDGS